MSELTTESLIRNQLEILHNDTNKTVNIDDRNQVRNLANIVNLQNDLIKIQDEKIKRLKNYE